MKLLGQELGLATHSIPMSKPEFKQWVVCCFIRSRAIPSADQLISIVVGRIQPPAPFTASPDELNPKSNHLLVTASFGRILRKGQLELFSPGRRLNVHPSLLPHYRGPAPIQHALLNGDKETGVCVIEMLKMKAGPVDSGDVWGSEKTVSQAEFFNSPSLQGRLANSRRSHFQSITGHSRETRRQSPSLRSAADVTVKGLSRRIFCFLLSLILPPKVEAKPQEALGDLKVAPMISAADSFVDPRVQTADQIVRIYGSLEVRSQLQPGSTQSLNRPVLETSGPGIS